MLGMVDGGGGMNDKETNIDATPIKSRQLLLQLGGHRDVQIVVVVVDGCRMETVTPSNRDRQMCGRGLWLRRRRLVHLSLTACINFALEDQ